MFNIHVIFYLQSVYDTLICAPKATHTCGSTGPLSQVVLFTPPRVCVLRQEVAVPWPLSHHFRFNKQTLNVDKLKKRRTFKIGQYKMCSLLVKMTPSWQPEMQRIFNKYVKQKNFYCFNLLFKRHIYQSLAPFKLTRVICTCAYVTIILLGCFVNQSVFITEQFQIQVINCLT